MQNYKFNDLENIMDTLLGENGCPWDKAQTHESIADELIEECYEAVDAIKSKNPANLCEELGDICLHVVFHSKIAEKNNEFKTEDVINGICEKMIRRHSHVFGDIKAVNAEESLINWDEEKQKEKGYTSKTDKLKKVPKAFPALLRAQKVQGIAEKSGVVINGGEINWSLANELSQMFSKKNTLTEEELGEVLFKIAKISRKFKLNAEIALTNYIEKFINRFEQEENAGKLE